MSNKYLIKKIGVDNEYQEYVSNTTITGQIDKGDPFYSWIAKITLEKQNVNAYKNQRDNTRDIGSELHHLIESFINMELCIQNKEVHTFNENSFFQQNIFNDYQLKQMFMQFFIWQKKNVKRFIESERPVCNQETCTAGSLDFVYEGFDGLIYLKDLKTTSYKPFKKDDKINFNLKPDIYISHKIQTAGYKSMRESMEGDYKIYCERNGETWTKQYYYGKIKIDKCGILNIEQDYFNIINFDISEDMINNYIESFNALVTFYYKSVNRRLKNKRTLKI